MTLSFIVPPGQYSRSDAPVPETITIFAGTPAALEPDEELLELLEELAWPELLEELALPLEELAPPEALEPLEELALACGPGAPSPPGSFEPLAPQPRHTIAARSTQLRMEAPSLGRALPTS
jgi:hypothetical protein